MSTRANIIIQDDTEKLFFYRHSDGYPECCGEDLKDFVKGYLETGAMRDSVSQSAGWLIIRGHFEYHNTPSKTASNDGKGMGWKVGAYEPTTCIHGDIDYLYIIDLTEKTLQVRQSKSGFWDKATVSNTKVIETFNFDGTKAE